jgi:HEXXH motif-containing protein
MDPSGRIPFQPVSWDRDPLTQQFQEHRERALAASVGRLSKRFGTELAPVAAALDVFQALPPTERRWVLTRPHFHDFWFRLSNAYKEGDSVGVRAVGLELCRFVVVPALRAGCFPQEGLLLPIDPDGQIPLLGGPTLSAPRVAPMGEVPALQRNGQLVLGSDQRLEIEALLSDSVAPDLMVAGSIPLAAPDPRTSAYLREMNIVEPPYGQERGDVEPVRPDTAQRVALEEALHLLHRCWPEMHREVLEYVQLIVPFRSKFKDAFTNTAWWGAIFLNARFENPVLNLERLVHETSHLRLNLVVEVRRLFQDSGWATTAASPFRPGARPMIAIYHGAFVFIRVAEAMARAQRAGFGDVFGARVSEITPLVDDAIATLRANASFSAEGQDLLDEMASRMSAIAQSLPDSVRHGGAGAGL